MRSPRSTSPPKSAWPGVSTMLIFVVAVADGGVLREDRDALLALQVHRVHHALGDVLVRAERAGLPQHGVDERRLAVVDVRHDGDVSDVVALGHRRQGSGGRPRLCRPARFTSRLRTHHDGLTMRSDDARMTTSTTPPPDGRCSRSGARRCPAAGLAAAARRDDRSRRRPVGRLRHRSCLRSLDGSVVSFPVSPRTRVRLNGRPASLTRHRARVRGHGRGTTAKGRAVAHPGVRQPRRRSPTAGS